MLIIMGEVNPRGRSAAGPFHDISNRSSDSNPFGECDFINSIVDTSLFVHLTHANIHNLRPNLHELFHTIGV